MSHFWYYKMRNVNISGTRSLVYENHISEKDYIREQYRKDGYI